MAAIVREKKQGSGTWWIFINHQGYRKSKRIGDKKTAEKIAEQINAKIALDEFGLDTPGPDDNLSHSHHTK